MFVVGQLNPIRSRELDLVVVDPSELSRSTWLGPELASHIATFGVWLKGSGEWRHHVRVSDATVATKARRLRTQAETVSKLSRIQSPARRRHHATKLRRNLQRLRLLASGSPMLTNPELDQIWEKTDSRMRSTLVAAVLADFQLGGSKKWDDILSAQAEGPSS